MPNADIMIALADLSKTYQTAAGSFPAIRGIDLEITAGELVAVVGRSGSGKSTLLHLIGGIDRPSSGSVTVGGTAIELLRPGRLASWRGRTVGFVFQFFQLLPTLTAAENVMLPMDFRRTIPARERRARALELLERFGISALAQKLPATLSGGEQQRVAIARALANRPPVVLADEPTGNLDSATARDVLSLFREVADGGTTVVLATHDPDIAGVIDRVVEIADGAIVSVAGSAPPEPTR